MSPYSDNAVPSEPAAAAQRTPRSPWHTPTIDDADVTALTEGGGTSGVEGTPFLKTGS